MGFLNKKEPVPVQAAPERRIAVEISFQLYEDGSIVPSFLFDDDIPQDVAAQRLAEFLVIMDRPELMNTIWNNLLSIISIDKSSELLITKIADAYSVLSKHKSDYLKNVEASSKRRGPLVAPSDVFGFGKVKRTKTNG